MKAQVTNAERGTVLWGVNRLRSDGLVALLDDLVFLEKEGLAEERCDVVKASLGRLTNAATSIPDGSWWKGQIWKELQAFEDIYATWNGVDGLGPDKEKERRTQLRKLRKKRNKISTRIRNNQYILQQQLDLQLVRDSYEALGAPREGIP